MPNLPPYQIITLALIVFFGGLVSSATGFGSGIVRMPIMLLFLPLRLASPVENVMGLINNLFVLFIDKKARTVINWKILLGLLVGNFFGALAGSYLLANFSSGWFIKIIAVFIILWEIKYILENTIWKNQAEKEGLIKSNFVLDAVFGSVSGLGSSLFSIGGPPLVIYLQSVIKNNQDLIRSSLLGFFTANGLMQIFTLGINGLITREVLYLSFASLPLLFLGSFLGKKLHDQMNNLQYKISTAVVLILAGVLLLMR